MILIKKEQIKIQKKFEIVIRKKQIKLQKKFKIVIRKEYIKITEEIAGCDNEKIDRNT